MTAIELECARYNMIEQQIRPWDVLDQRVLDILAGVPREDFVPERYRRLAFSDVPIPLAHDQVMMNPNVEGRLLQALALQPNDRVLEVGTGSGFVSACLARLSGRVDSVDLFADFTEQAGGKLHRHGIGNVGLYTGDAARDWGTRLYDAIALTGALVDLPDSWRQRLAIGGRLFAVLGRPPILEAVLVTRIGEREWSRESLFETGLPYLIGAEPDAAFEF